MAKAKTYEPADVGFTQEYIDECVRNAKPYPYGEAYTGKKGYPLNRPTTATIPQISWESVGEKPPKTGRQSFSNLQGYRFGGLVVLGFAGVYVFPSNNRRAALWYCWCIDGQTIIARRGALLTSGGTHQSEKASCRKAVSIRYGIAVHDLGDSSHPLYQKWNGIKQRCENTSEPAYRNYGGRGIYLDPRWQDRHQFYADVGEKPSDDHEIERIDVNGPYAAWNCCWLPYWMQPYSKRVTLPYAEIIALHKMGLTHRGIARRLGCSKTGVGVALNHPHREAIAEFQTNQPKAFRPDLRPTDEQIERDRNRPELVSARMQYAQQQRAEERAMLEQERREGRKPMPEDYPYTFGLAA